MNKPIQVVGKGYDVMLLKPGTKIIFEGGMEENISEESLVISDKDMSTMRNDWSAIEENVSTVGKDFIVVKSFKLAERLATLPKADVPESLEGKAIIVAPEGIEFLSREDLQKALDAKPTPEQIEQAKQGFAKNYDNKGEA